MKKWTRPIDKDEIVHWAKKVKIKFPTESSRR